MAKPETSNIETAADTAEVKLGRLAQFRANHPRVSRAITTTGVVLAAAGGAYLLGKRSSDDGSSTHLEVETEQVPDFSSEV